VENELLKKENIQLRSQLDSVQKALVRVQETVENQERAKMIPIVLANTNMTIEEVYDMDTESLFSLTETFRILKRPPTGVTGVKNKFLGFYRLLTRMKVPSPRFLSRIAVGLSGLKTAKLLPNLYCRSAPLSASIKKIITA